MKIWLENCASRFEADKAVNDVSVASKKNTQTFSAKAETFLATRLNSLSVI
jgi:hypothetical protein